MNRIAAALLMSGLLLVACGDSASDAQKQAKETAAVLTGDAAGAASDNPLCKLFTTKEAADWIGAAVAPPDNATMGAGCQWAAKDDSGDMMVIKIPANYHEVPSLAPGFKELTTYGAEARAFVVPEMGGFAAGAIQGESAFKVSLAGKKASAEAAEALLAEFIRREQSAP